MQRKNWLATGLASGVLVIMNGFLNAPAGAAEFDLHEAIERHATRTGLPPSLIAAVIRVESNANPCAVSPKGATGLMQLMPATARSLGVGHAMDPEENLRGGTDYLARQVEAANGDVWLALARYNYGTRAFERAPAQWPRETLEYVGERVLHWVQSAERGRWQLIVPQSIGHCG